MRGFRLQLVASCLLFAMTAGALSASKMPQQVLDLHYGEVLFHFYQQDYFTAITHLMAAQQQDLLEHHKADSELLLGGMQLSYGMLDEAERRLKRLLDADADKEIRNRAWYYLAKISYQRNLYDKAYASILDVDEPADATIRAQAAILGANIRMALGRNTEAAELLREARAPGGWQEYLHINRGIALLRAGDIAAGREALDSFGEHDADTEELRSLRDRANLGLGYQLLRAGEPDKARHYLNRVRLTGPYTQAALLGAGWADAERGQYQQALTPWLSLIKLASFEPPVQEAYLAVPHAFAKLGDYQRAVQFGNRAIAFYDREQVEIESAIGSVESGVLLSLLSQARSDLSGGWLHDNPQLHDIPAGRYLVDVLSGNDFQETLKDYRDLSYLEGLLSHWLEHIRVYSDMVDARRSAYELRAPLVRQRLAQGDNESATAAWRQLEARLQSQEASDDPLGLASTAEAQQWQRLSEIQDRLMKLPPSQRHRRMQNKASWLQGVLYWNIQADYKARLWEVKKQHAELEPVLAESDGRRENLIHALQTAQAGFSGYDQRIENLRARILALISRVQLERINATTTLQKLALHELETRKERLASYRSQARYALARSYDQLARNVVSQP
jgi:predicted negative regulator of RcsB-dependent stress response